jgi:hypothetical protein
MSDSYWTIDTSLFDGSFRYFGREAVLVRGKVHTEQERYRPSDVNQEITPVGVKEGVRTYLHLRPFVLMPDITLTIGLYPELRPGGAIGEVVSARERKMKEVEIGNVQAWSYPDGTLVLWECFLYGFVSDRPISTDPNTTALWRSVESFLAQQFPRSERVVTTAHDPMFETEEYQVFLRALGYEPVATGAYGKKIEQS